MKYTDVELKGHKISKTLPKIWTTADNEIPDNEMFVLDDFSIYAKKMYESLIGIKKYYEKEFNADNTTPIDEYIELFDESYDNFLKAIIPDEEVRNDLLSQEVVAGRNNLFDARFSVLEETPRDKRCFTFDENGKISGFTDEVYAKISKYAQNIFMIEKLCSFTTRKFWQNEITNVENLDLSKPYKILVKCIVPEGWRRERKSKKLNEYMENREYHSTSLIDQNSFHKTFFTTANKYAMLLIEYNDQDFVCASPSDDYSEEVINSKNPLTEKRVFSDIFLQDEQEKNNKNHKFFAEAVECETPKNILSNIRFYSEVNFKNVNPKAVISPNKESLDFAKDVAKKYGDLPVILQTED